jgi:hypothetical protein
MSASTSTPNSNLSITYTISDDLSTYGDTTEEWMLPYIQAEEKALVTEIAEREYPGAELEFENGLNSGFDVQGEGSDEAKMWIDNIFQSTWCDRIFRSVPDTEPNV